MKSHHTLLHSLPLLASLAIPVTFGCASDDRVDGDPDHGDDTASRTDLDLLAFRKAAIKKLEQRFGDHDYSKAKIFFKDGAGSTDLEPVFDHGRLIYVADQPAVSPLPGMKAAYFIGMDGTEGVRLVDAAPTLNYFFDTGIAVLDAGASPAEISALEDELRDLAPDAEIQLLEAIGLLTFSDPAGTGFVSLFEAVEQADIVSSVELDAEAFRVPFEFDGAIDLGTGKKKKKVELLDKTGVTRQLRDDGLSFVTEPSLPEPFGPGRLELTLEWTVGVLDGFDTDDCASDASELTGVELLEVAEAAFTIEASPGAASLVGTLQCVASIEAID